MKNQRLNTIALHPSELDALTPDELADMIAAIAARQARAGGLLMKGVTTLAGRAEAAAEMVPAEIRAPVEDAIRWGLTRAYRVAAASHVGATTGSNGAFASALARLSTEWSHRTAAMATGAAGGFFGAPGTLAELPATITLILRAIQDIAHDYGEDIADPATRLECLAVFGDGGPSKDDDGIDLGLVAARTMITGDMLNRVIAQIAPKAAAVMGQKFAAQTVPVLGAVTGAGVNYAFLAYYQELAHIRFALRALGRSHGPAEVSRLFHAERARLERSGSKPA